jgi:hypothetical protein
MDDALLVSVLNALADFDEQLEPISYRELVFVAEFGDWNALTYSIAKCG